MPATKSQSSLQIFLIPTRTIETYSQNIDLVKLAQKLNNSLKRVRPARAIEFKVIVGARHYSSTEPRYILETNTGRQQAYSAIGLNLRQRSPFRHFRSVEHRTTSNDVFRSERDTAIVDLDAFGQLRDCALSTAGVEANDVDSGIVVGIGSEVIGPDRAGEEWSGSAVEDAYSCLADIVTFPDKTNDDERPTQNICFISLARAYSRTVFGDSLKNDSLEKPRKRAIIARYIVVNIAHALSSMLFRMPLPEDHPDLCVAADNWTGGEQESYQATGLCNACHADAERAGLTQRYKRALRNSETVFKSINRITAVANVIDGSVDFTERVKFWRDIVLVASLIAVVGGLIVAYDSKDPLPIFLLDHWPALIFAAIFLLGAAYVSVRFVISTRSIP